MSNHASLGSTWPAFRAVALSVVPESQRLDEGGWGELRAIVEEALGSRPARLGRQLRLFLRALQWLPLARHGRRLGALDPERRARFLERLQDSRLTVLRRGFWGLRTLALMGYYGRDSAAREIGYRADRRGWELRH